MLICVECERVFDQPRHIVERHGLDTPPYEEYDACPYCFGTNIHPAKTCDVCGKWLTGGYIKTIDGQRIATTVIPRGMLGTNDPPLRYVEHAVTMAEAPLEISLTISVSNCAFRCHGCHSQYLQEDVGKPLLPDLESLIDRYKGLISCVCLMGEGRNPVEQLEAQQIIRKKGLKTCLYSGNDDETTFKPLFGVLDYLKTGHYDEKQGGLDCPTTNQRFYRIENGRLIDRTSLFWERSVEK